MDKLKSIFFLPLMTILLLGLINFFYHYYSYILEDLINLSLIDVGEKSVYLVGLFLSVYWLLVRLINYFTHYLLSSRFFHIHQVLSLIVPFSASIVKVVILLISFNTMSKNVGLPSELSYFLEKLSSALIIGALAWALFKIVQVSEQLLLYKYNEKTKDKNTARKIRTQLSILKRLTFGLIIVLAFGGILMLFDNVRALGAGVMTTAGIFGLVLTFTAQRSLGSIFAGLEIVIAQPIKMGDSLVIENEFGVVEEINFHHVVIKLWDWRRLIVPINYFFEKPFQNWSCTQSGNLIGTVYIYVDYTFPVSKLRVALKNILAASPLWDGEVANVQVSDLQDKVMQLRVLSSARNPKETWELCCEVREKLIEFIVQHHPQSLPMARTRS